MAVETTEIEARFIGIDYEELKRRLMNAQASDKGIRVFSETIFFDKELKWNTDRGKFVRVRDTGRETFITFKHNDRDAVDGTREVELKVDSYESSCTFLHEVGLIAYRRQEKKRHTYVLGEVTVDIDFWPSLPPYAELEGPSEDHLRRASERLNLDWAQADFHNAAWVIENVYAIPFKKLRSFTFNEIA